MKLMLAYWEAQPCVRDLVFLPAQVVNTTAKSLTSQLLVQQAFLQYYELCWTVVFPFHQKI